MQNSAGQIQQVGSYSDVAQLNFANDTLRRYMISNIRYWVFAANVDGFRFDYFDHLPFDFRKELITNLKAIAGRNLLLVAEGSSNDQFVTGADMKYGFTYYGALKQVFGAAQAPVSALTSLNETENYGANAQQMVLRYTTNHDVNGSDDIPQNLLGGMDGSLAAFATVAFMKAAPMVYNGQELGLGYKLVFPFTSPKINWTPNDAVTRRYKQILNLRNTLPALREKNLSYFSTADVVGFSKTLNGEVVVVMINSRNAVKTINLPATFAGTSMQNMMTGNAEVLSTAYSLAPYEYVVFKAL